MGLIQTRGSRHWRESVNTYKKQDFFDLIRPVDFSPSNVVSYEGSLLYGDEILTNNPTKVILGGNVGRKLPTIQNGIMYYSSKTGNVEIQSSVIAFPLKNPITVGVTKATFLLTAPNVDNWVEAFVQPVPWAVYIESGATPNINLNEEKTFTAITNQPMNTHVIVGFYHGDWQIKDIQLFTKE